MAYNVKNATPADDSAKSRVIPTTGAEDVVIEPVDSANAAYMQSLAFNEEKLHILLHPSTSERDTSRLVSVGVNGKKQYIMRGEPQWIRRKYVEVLIKARPDLIGHDASVNPRTGKELNKITANSVSKYNFDILEDPNPNGPVWLADLRKAASQ